MRSVLAFALMLCLAGCETSALGGRCTNNFDCDRSTTGAVAQCVRSTNPSFPCGGDYCICCPTTHTTDAGVPLSCMNGQAVVDSGPQPDVQPDTGPDVTDAGCLCAVGQYCSGTFMDGGQMCSLQKPSGLPCLADGDCQTSHCAQGVCCNSACTGAGLSCNSSPDFAGVCTAVTATDAGTDVVVVDTGVDTGVDATATDGATE